MKRAVVILVVGTLMLGGMALPAEANGRHRGPRRTHVVHHHDSSGGPGHFLGGFFAGAATILVLDALTTPRVVYASPPPPAPVYYRAPVCRDVLIPGRWEVRPRQDNGFITYYQVWVPDQWQRECY